MINIDLSAVGEVQKAIAPASSCAGLPQNIPYALDTVPQTRYERLDWDIGYSNYSSDTAAGYTARFLIDRVVNDSTIEGRFVGRYIKDTTDCQHFPADPDTLTIERGWFRAVTN